MSDVVVVDDSGGDVFRHVVGFDADADAVWFRFDSAADMCRLGEGIVPRSGSVSAFLLTRDINGPAIRRLSDFQGAYGRAKLYGMNKNKTFRRKLEAGGDSFFLDGGPANFGEEWEGYLRAVYNASFGFLMGGDASPDLVMDNAFHEKSVSGFFSYIIAHCDFAGFFLEDNRVAWSLVLIGRALPCSIASTNWIDETPGSTLESVKIHGDRLASRLLLEDVLRCRQGSWHDALGSKATGVHDGEKT